MSANETPIKEMTKEQAKYLLTTLALVKLQESSVHYSRAELFKPGDTERKSDSVAKMGSQKGWQNHLLTKLVDRQVIEKISEGSQVTYRGLDLGLIDKVVASARNGGMGEHIKALLWPKDFDDITVPKKDTKEDVEEEEPEEESESDAAGLDVVKEVADQLSAMVEPLVAIAEGFKAHDQKLDAQTEELAGQTLALGEVRKDIALLGEILSDVTTRIEKAVNTVVDEDRRKFADLASVLSEIYARRRSVENQFSSVTRLEEKALLSMEEILGRMKDESGGTGKPQGSASK